MWYIFKILCVVLLALPLFAATTGAIYLEGQAPPEGTDVHILAASSGLSEDSGKGTGGSGGGGVGLTTPTLSTGFGYPAIPAFRVPNVPTQPVSLSSLTGIMAAGQSPIGSAGYPGKLSSPKLPASQLRFKPMRVFGENILVRGSALQ